MSKYSPDTPLRLDVAVREAFPAGGMTVSGLRKEIAKGRLEVELIAGKQFTTLLAIARMRELCRVCKLRKVATPEPVANEAALRARQQRLLARLDEDAEKLRSERTGRSVLRTKREAK
jgi:hypothetical protein